MFLESVFRGLLYPLLAVYFLGGCLYLCKTMKALKAVCAHQKACKEAYCTACESEEEIINA